MNPDPVRCLHALHERQLLPGRRLAVLLVGSVALGWANEKSDYDFYVVTETPWRRPNAARRTMPLQPSYVPTDSIVLDGRRWELKYWLDSQVNQMLDKVSWEQFESGAAVADPLAPAEESFLERLISCVPLEGEQWVRRRREALADTAFQAFLVTRSLAAADGCLDDALGQLATGDVTSAVLSARQALGHAVDALLESRGVYGSQLPKWRARRLAEARLPDLPFERYWALETMASFDQARPEAWVEEVVVLCRALSLRAEI
ncbi:nucleotidyltransferase domain-containing protein [Streptosporangium sp. NPDC049376]|uniref:nucleotidyltransferase domain-containing protein n=1 Tax=Streptosporangium sp. NPDC049376 TaxID=3366192 RepID=UPI003791306E